MVGNVPLCSIVLKTSGQDSGHIDYVIHHGMLEEIIRKGREKELGKTLMDMVMRVGIVAGEIRGERVE